MNRNHNTTGRSIFQTEKDLLDELETSALIINKNSKTLHSEATQQAEYVEGLDDAMETTRLMVLRETVSISEAREMQEGFCWMYAVIAAESLLLLILLWAGL
mmetsp:Transcript_2230/g.3025  ORF Transcript_2230/g.3025 Transcript_2230/m.3025 type:complete len:102 (-) Transcript_2230:379-684(-)